MDIPKSRLYFIDDNREHEVINIIITLVIY